MQKIAIKIVCIALYLFTSSVLLHAGVMAHDSMLFFSDNITVPCHHADGGQSNQKSPQGDCFEQCMGVYNGLGGSFTFSLLEIKQYYQDYSIQYNQYSHKDILNITINDFSDPPPISIVGYARIGKEIKKVE